MARGVGSYQDNALAGLPRYTNPIKKGLEDSSIPAVDDKINFSENSSQSCRSAAEAIYLNQWENTLSLKPITGHLSEKIEDKMAITTMLSVKVFLLCYYIRRNRCIYYTTGNTLSSEKWPHCNKLWRCNVITTGNRKYSPAYTYN